MSARVSSWGAPALVSLFVAMAPSAVARADAPSRSSGAQRSSGAAFARPRSSGTRVAPPRRAAPSAARPRADVTPLQTPPQPPTPPVEVGGHRPADSSWLGAQGSPGRVVAASAGEAHVGLWVELPASAATTTRVPMALSLVIDTSGSMRGERIEHAREAATRFLEILQPGDMVSIYAVHTEVEEIAAPILLAPGVRETLVPRIRALQANGNTNLHGGLLRGQEAVSRAPATHRIRRVVLISDGRATVGPTTTEAFGEVASAGARQGIAIAAIGVGDEYDDRALRELAVKSAGRLYHVDDGATLATVVSSEVTLLGQSAATDTRLEIVPAPGVTIAAVETIGGRTENGHAMFDIGTMYAPQTREYLVRVRLPASQPGRYPLAHVVLRYRDMSPEAVALREDLFVSYEATPDLVAVRASESPRVAAMVALQAAANTQLVAAESAGRGNTAAADQELARAQQSVGDAAARTRDATMRARLQREHAAIRRRRTEVREAQRPAAARAVGRRMGSEAMDPWY